MTVSPRAQTLLEMAASDPQAVLRDGPTAIDELTNADSKSVAYRAMSVAARSAATLKESVTYARISADVAERPSLRFEALGTLAGSVAMSGDVERALQILKAASAEAFGTSAAKLEFQRGAILTSMGEYEAALVCYEKALRVFRLNEDPDFIARVLHNQGFISIHLGRLDEAESVLGEARELEAASGRHLEVSGIDHNLGLLASYRGDIPEALRRLTMSDETHMQLTGDEVPRHVSRCDVLLSAGLYREALDLAKRIARGAREKGRAEDEADALLVAARAALLSGDPEQAVKLASIANKRFSSQGRDIWLRHASLVIAEARYESEGASAELLEFSRQVAQGLEDSQFVVGAAQASILSGRIAIDLDEVEAAQADLDGVIEGRSGPVELKIQRAHATALLRMAQGDARGADSAARSGLKLLDEYQSELGASDLRYGIERRGLELGRIGLRLAVDSGRPQRIFKWMERTRARALRFPPVLPSDDEQILPLVADLRRATGELRENPDDFDLLKKRSQLQEELSRVHRSSRATGEDDSTFSIARLVEALGDRMLVELGVVGDQLVSVVLSNGRFTLVPIGEWQPIVSELGLLRFDMRRSVRLNRNPDGVQRAVYEFDGMLGGKIGGDADQIVLVPPGALMAAPWSVLPSLAKRTVTIAPSAEIWWRAQRQTESNGRVVLAAGPDLEHSQREIDVLADAYRLPKILGPGESAESFGAAIQGARVAHAACHARFEVDNPMFSALRLGDGDFNVYDMERLEKPPRLMVLSACDSGYTDTNAGDELTGLTSALLSMGSQAVVASVGLVPDTEATADLMLMFHRGIAHGLEPSEALSRAQTLMASDPDGFIAAASFLCIGGG